MYIELLEWLNGDKDWCEWSWIDTGGMLTMTATRVKNALITPTKVEIVFVASRKRDVKVVYAL